MKLCEKSSKTNAVNYQLVINLLQYLRCLSCIHLKVEAAESDSALVGDSVVLTGVNTDLPRSGFRAWNSTRKPSKITRCYQSPKSSPENLNLLADIALFLNVLVDFA